MNNNLKPIDSKDKATLILEDGSVYECFSFGASKTICAEIVFNTGMTGYQEILSDPSYAGQAVVMTYPLIGNYGISPANVESEKVQASAIIVREYCQHESNWKSNQNISEYLKKENIAAIYGIDTRMLTKKIRTRGTMNCLITTDPCFDELKKALISYRFPADIVSKISRKEALHLEGSGKKIALIDLGVKSGIIRYIQNADCAITLLPWNTDSNTILSSGYDALFLSNGPGDPKDVSEVVSNVKHLISKLPIYGICLGHQILALALGADTYKLKFGHRGSNHPVIDLRTGKVIITAQNHGYAVSESGIPDSMIITHKNINDSTIEGFSCPELNIYSVQFHPEDGPGPEDANFIFNEWLQILEGCNYA